MGDIYQIFEPTCPDLARSSRGKVEALRSCLLQQFDRHQSQPPEAETVGIPSNLLSGWEEEELEDCRDEELVGRSLLARVGERRYELHQLIREFFAAKLGTELQEVAEGLQRRVALVMVAEAQQIPQTVTLGVIAKVEEALPHLEVVAESLTPLLENDEDPDWVFIGLARVGRAQSRWLDAEGWYKRCLNMAEQQLGADHPDTATSLNNLAGLYESMGRYDQAESLNLRALDILTRCLPENHPHIQTTIGNFVYLVQVEITPIAEAQIEQAYCWYRERNSEFADRWFRSLMNAIHSIRHSKEPNSSNCLRSG